ncbi:PREDICTED: probable E3 ubiquitin-protein ligase ATL45 [Camelina sativa]|uniref:Probable E3 ubiquitin-protein ligase ATL45 n=1 Tax=Camelina sativa TaxID=90675 RepID=A0ABM0TW00_CAMSA|nr:PREDICTED: probable E3 ubiquitin-protein ligase ATL45 [Camelina sativa]
MTRSSRFLGTASSPPPPEEILAAETDMVVILSALLCALICVAGLAAVARCAWLRRLTGVNSAATGEYPPPPPNKGLKKKALQALPKSTYTASPSTSKAAAEDLPCSSSGGDGDDSSTECAICITEFAEGEEIRILPLCNHAFHVACIDKWLTSRSSCPSCRRILVPVKCDRCGHHASTAETRIKDQPQPPSQHQHHHPSQFTSSAIIPAFLP